jgi:hypothetical protein
MCQGGLPTTGPQESQDCPRAPPGKALQGKNAVAFEQALALVGPALAKSLAVAARVLGAGSFRLLRRSQVLSSSCSLVVSMAGGRQPGNQPLPLLLLLLLLYNACGAPGSCLQYSVGSAWTPCR